MQQAVSGRRGDGRTAIRSRCSSSNRCWQLQPPAQSHSQPSWCGRGLECSQAERVGTNKPTNMLAGLRLGQPPLLTLNVVQQDLVNLRLAQVAAVKQAVQLVLL